MQSVKITAAWIHSSRDMVGKIFRTVELKLFYTVCSYAYSDKFKNRGVIMGFLKKFLPIIPCVSLFAGCVTNGSIPDSSLSSTSTQNTYSSSKIDTQSSELRGSPLDEKRNSIGVKEIIETGGTKNIPTLESRINQRRAELEASLNWKGRAKTTEELLEEARLNSNQPSKLCGSNIPTLSASNLAIQEVTTDDLKQKILNAHQSFLTKKVNQPRSVQQFNRLKSEVESARSFYNTYISKHCAYGSLMVQGLDKSESETSMLINMMNNFVADLNAR